MHSIKIILAVVLAVATAGAWAQAPLSQNMTQTATSNTATGLGTYPTANVPYSSQANYSMMEDSPIPQAQGAEKSSSASYIGVLAEKWETDKRGRRGTFIHNGQEISVSNGQPTYELQRRPTITLPSLKLSAHDSLVGTPSHLP